MFFSKSEEQMKLASAFLIINRAYNTEKAIFMKERNMFATWKRSNNSKRIHKALKRAKKGI